DDRRNLVATNLVRCRCHRGLPDCRMAVEDRLDLDRGNILARSADDVLLAIDEMQIAIVVAGDDITGMKPSALPRFRGGFRVLQIFPEEAVARIRARP